MNKKMKKFKLVGNVSQVSGEIYWDMIVGLLIYWITVLFLLFIFNNL